MTLLRSLRSGFQVSRTRRSDDTRSQRIELLLTLDADFANMLRFPPAGTPGVIRLKNHPPTEAAIREGIQKALCLLKDRSLEGCLVVLHRDVIRIRS